MRGLLLGLFARRTSLATGLGVVLLVAAFSGGVATGWKYRSGQLAGLRQVLAEERLAKVQTEADLAGARAVALTEALGLVRDQQALLDRQADQTLMAIASIPGALAADRQRLTSLFRSHLDDPRYDCRRLPLPEPVLDGLRRPGTDRSRAPSDSSVEGVRATAGAVSTATRP